MSDTDSFIEEVSEEVRRDRLFALMRRYGWIAIALVLLIVGGAAYYEYSKAKESAAAQAMGDSIIAALEDDDPIKRQAAFDAITPEQAGTAAIVDLLKVRSQVESGDVDKAKATLKALADNAGTPLVYRQVATFKLLGMQANDLSTDERRTGYQTLIGQNPQLRLLAEEQLALIEIEDGDPDAALMALEAIVLDEESTVGLRRRATQLIVTLGGDLSVLEQRASNMAQDSAAESE